MYTKNTMTRRRARLAAALRRFCGSINCMEVNYKALQRYRRK
ncbi:hypothetical protein HMPREF9554_01374 [Treponema phagedenis F0421]|nr:hypothetical protein HMPREF9554_01374 [Treponema phagedenis F0421]